MNRWATQIDMLLFSYVTKVNVISIGNYRNGFVNNNMQLLLNQILGNRTIDISLKGRLHVYFHKFGSPLEKITNGNHFGHLEAINNPEVRLNNNTIQEISVNNGNCFGCMHVVTIEN